MMENKHTYRPDIDGLRAIAVLIVVLYHAGIENISGGFVGVDVFFVISGYVIMLSLLKMLNDGTFSITEFYFRRARRIMPALFFMLLITTVFSYVWFLPTLFDDYLKSLLSSLGFVSNFYFWSTTHYFGASAELKPLLHTWSLSVEEQYYIFMPIYVFLVYRYFGQNWKLALYPPFFISLILSCYLIDKAASANYFMLPTRGWELLLGAIIAAVPPFKVSSRWQSWILGFLGLGMIILSAVYYNKYTPFPGYSAVIPCLGAAFIILAGSKQYENNTMANPIGYFLATRPLLYIGTISYSLYLLHWPVTVFFRYQLLAPLNTNHTVWIIIISFALAAFSYHFVEKPYRYSKNAKRSSVFTFSGVGMAGFGFTAVVLLHLNSQPADQPHLVDSVNKTSSSPCFLMNAKNYSQWSESECIINNTQEEKTKILLWGDSFLNHYAPGIKLNSQELNAQFVKYSSAGCPPILSFESYALPYCNAFNQNAIEVIKENKYDLVIISAKWTDHAKNGLEKLESTLSELDSLGVRYLVIGQSPQFITDVSIINDLKGKNEKNHSWPIIFGPDINQELSNILNHNNFIDPMNNLCIDGTCPYKKQNVLLYSDYGHLSEHGSNLVVKNMINTINDWIYESKH
ncbi:acyltransferase family protein [Vibrio sp. YMD68]|uniref:acyltransferase family protein n=1 Tax=Vibrio sp. YMD68 TaxID=3042300 RepID=UPI00249C799F|nr:acyltransferase family protein [Vibrio sp. YMD68]WGV98432.1 acyltransferase family protein [Vibrio sp. YMD68]